MNKREEIRRGIEQTICRLCDDVAVWKEGQALIEAREFCYKEGACAYCTDLAEALSINLHSQGVVIKVDERTLFAGYSVVVPMKCVVVEPLIKEGE